MDISSPTLPADHPDRFQECAIQMENAIIGLWEIFEGAGWTEEEFDRALLEEAGRGAAPDGDNNLQQEHSRCIPP